MACFTLRKGGADHVAGDRNCPQCDAGYPKTSLCCKHGMIHREGDVTRCDSCGASEPVPAPVIVPGPSKLQGHKPPPKTPKPDVVPPKQKTPKKRKKTTRRKKRGAD